ncbi:MAG: hypothetical protein PHQ75_07045, partial [Thermoguttaceae bacterium]|nr:hypothetical protein [Thermoguttaceae bacterium]
MKQSKLNCSTVIKGVVAVVVFAIVLLVVAVWISASRKAFVPNDFQTQDASPVIRPDYSSITLPPNIAPMNFEILVPGNAFVTEISSTRGSSIIVPGRALDISPTQWKRLLAENAGETLRFDIYVQQDSKWVRLRPILNQISKDPIDPWISYRQIEPGYEFFNVIKLQERNLESFNTRNFADNELLGTSTCFNCHNWQDRKTDRYMFHVRNATPGTVLVDHGRIRKIDLKPEGLFSSCAYPSWHPTLNLIAFSVNRTFQAFHSLNPNRIEVIDERSDLALFDVEKNEVISLLKTEKDFETFPSWSADGKALYYCCATVDLPPAQPGDIVDENTYSSGSKTDDPQKENTDTPRKAFIRNQCSQFKYNLMRMSFDPSTRTFGNPEIVVDAAKINKSISHPRVSPDGRYLLYTLFDYGTFSIWHPESDLHLLDLKTGKSRALDEVN